jgi:hypothetical protein
VRSVPTAWRVLGLQIQEQPPAMEVSCKYIEYATAAKQQVVVFLTIKNELVTKTSRALDLDGLFG